MRRWPKHVTIFLIGLLAASLLIGRTVRSVRQSGAEGHRHDFGRIDGQVVDETGPVADARVRLKGHATFTQTDWQGRFSLDRPSQDAYTVTASKPGYFIEGVSAGDSRRLVIKVKRLPEEDNPEYAWVDPRPDPSQTENCGNCHEPVYREWADSGHARAASSPHFRNLYDGSDWHGRPNQGWNLRAEYPEAAGVCASCHAPSLEPGDPAIDDLGQVAGVEAQGVHCDFCHKVQNAPMESLGLAHGRYGLELLRPTSGQLIFGPLDDVDRGVETFSPLQKDSRYCASCHEGVLLGVHVYSTYTEWRESPAGQAGKQCQHCHMTPTGSMTNMAPEAGGIPRDPQSLASHTFFPGGRLGMLRRALEVELTHRRSDTVLQVDVSVRASDVGHRVPTGFVDRHLILLVQPFDSLGNALTQVSGPVLSDLVGDPLRGQPGELFARILVDSQGQSPVPFWRAESQLADTRLSPANPHTSSFGFPSSASHVRVQLIYRRFWDAVARIKAWPDNELVVYDKTWPIE